MSRGKHAEERRGGADRGHGPCDGRRDAAPAAREPHANERKEAAGHDAEDPRRAHLVVRELAKLSRAHPRPPCRAPCSCLTRQPANIATATQGARKTMASSSRREPLTTTRMTGDATASAQSNAAATARVRRAMPRPATTMIPTPKPRMPHGIIHATWFASASMNPHSDPREVAWPKARRMIASATYGA